MCSSLWLFPFTYKSICVSAISTCAVKVICSASVDHQQANQCLSSPNAFVPTSEMKLRVRTELLLLLLLLMSRGIPDRHKSNLIKAFSVCLHVELTVVYYILLFKTPEASVNIDTAGNTRLNTGDR